MTPAAVDVLRPSWRRAVHSSPLPMLILDLTTTEVVDANDMAFDLLSLREGHRVDNTDHLQVDERHGRLIELLLSGTIDGFEARIQSRRAGHPSVEYQVWLRALVQPGEPPRFAIAAITEGDDVDPVIQPPMTRAPRMAAGATDEDWVCQWVTREVTGLLGYRPSEFVGTPMLALAHPDIAADLVLALTHVGDGGGGAVIHARLRGADGRWRVVQMVVSPRPEERRGAMFLLLPEHEVRPRADDDAAAWQTAGDAHAAALARHGDWPRDTLADLSARQWEIVTRLLRGERVPGIAKAMYLSQSTVRNHLTAVFRKFGVHSQAELLAHLRHDVLEVGQSV